ncbi:MAG TPA: periplasmic heavy metal sensor [Candidatus Binatia bacterium]|nr:periplasmic heavy metal sensor [Candidatus Binatia bacterium]
MSPRLERALPWVLLLSLAANLFCGGVIFAHHFAHGGSHGSAHRGPGHRHRHGVLPGPHELRAALSPEAQARFDTLHQEHRPVIRERLRELAAARRTLAEELRTEPLDRARLDAAFARVREAEAQLALETQTMFAKLAEGLGPQDRARLAALIPGMHGPGPEGATPPPD